MPPWAFSNVVKCLSQCPVIAKEASLCSLLNVKAFWKRILSEMSTWKWWRGGSTLSLTNLGSFDTVEELTIGLKLRWALKGVVTASICLVQNRVYRPVSLVRYNDMRSLDRRLGRIARCSRVHAGVLSTAAKGRSGSVEALGRMPSWGLRMLVSCFGRLLNLKRSSSLRFISISMFLR